MKFKLGLTGSMGMGKTSTAVLFAKYNCGVWDADKAVHRLYGKGGDAVKPIAKHFPKATTDGSVNRFQVYSNVRHALRKLRRPSRTSWAPVMCADRNEDPLNVGRAQTAAKICRCIF